MDCNLFLSIAEIYEINFNFRERRVPDAWLWGPLRRHCSKLEHMNRTTRLRVPLEREARVNSARWPGATLSGTVP
jgi:hypothetical protein